MAELEVDELRTLLKDARVSQRHRPDSNAWHQIGKSLSSGLESQVVRVIDTGRGEAQELLRDLKSRDNDGRARFPMLRGPKIGPMWVRMMANPGRAVIDRIETIPVAVDVQVRKVTESLGVAPTRGLPLPKAQPVIQQTWKNAVSEAEIAGPAGIEGTCAALDPALWFFGKHGCGHCRKADEKVEFRSRLRVLRSLLVVRFRKPATCHQQTETRPNAAQSTSSEYGRLIVNRSFH